MATTMTQTQSEWQRLWDSQPHSCCWHHERRHTIASIMDYLRAKRGLLGEVSMSMLYGDLTVRIDALDNEQGGRWYIEGGILPSEYDRFCKYLRSDHYEGWQVAQWAVPVCDCSVDEDLVAAALTTVLFLRGNAEPIEIVARSRKQHCLVAWLQDFRTDSVGVDPWDAFAEAAAARFDWDFAADGPSPKWLVARRDEGCGWPLIMEFVRELGFTGTKHALRCRVRRERQKAARRKVDEHLADPNRSQTEVPAQQGL